MAHKESGELQSGSSYALGEYSFRIERSSGTSPNYDKFEAICTKGGKNARKSIQLPSTTKMAGWYVEANSETADVYVVVDVPTGTSTSGFTDWTKITYSPPILGSEGINSGYNRWIKTTEEVLVIVLVYPHPDTSHSPPYYDSHGSVYVFSKKSGQKYAYQATPNKSSGPPDSSIEPNTPISYYKTVDGIAYYGRYINGWTVELSGPKIPYESISEKPTDYGTDIAFEFALEKFNGDVETKNVLIGRFAIELEDAGGAGTGSDWTDPGDYDYDDYPDPDERDPDDPTYTLNLEVVGALSGRHNDPLEDTSYSYVPSDKATVKDYGCGGDGGHGGGGGAGASNIVVYKFATSRADSKEIVCKPKRHGYGSGGGKGGKGGDGCILIYY